MTTTVAKSKEVPAVSILKRRFTGGKEFTINDIRKAYNVKRGSSHADKLIEGKVVKYLGRNRYKLA